MNIMYEFEQWLRILQDKNESSTIFCGINRVKFEDQP